MLGVPPGTYRRSDTFKDKVVVPAVLEVNGLSEIGVDIRLERHHPNIPPHEVSITWWRKEGDAFREAVRERNRSKIGRMARLRGTVESLSEPR